MHNISNENTKLFNKHYIILMIISFFSSGSFYLVNVILSAYAVKMGATLALSGVIIGCFSITSLIIRPFSGVIVNRINNKSVLMFAIVIMFISSLAYALVNNPYALIAVRILHGIGFALNGTVSLVLVSAVTPQKRMSEGIAYFGLAQMLACAVMPNIGAWVSDCYSYIMVFYIAAGIILINGIIIMMIPISGNEHTKEATNRSEEKKKFSVNDLICIKLLPLAIVGGLFSLFNGLNSSFMLLIGSERGISDIALYFTVNTIVIVLIRLLLGKIADRKNILYVLIPTIITAILAAVMIGMAASLTVILIASVFQAGGQGIAQPSLQAECIKRVDPQKRGTASGTYYMFSDIGQGLGAMIGGAVSGAWGYDVMYYGVAAIYTICLPFCVISLVKSRRARKEYTTVDL